MLCYVCFLMLADSSPKSLHISRRRPVFNSALKAAFLLSVIALLALGIAARWASCSQTAAILSSLFRPGRPTAAWKMSSSSSEREGSQRDPHHFWAGRQAQGSKCAFGGTADTARSADPPSLAHTPHKHHHGKVTAAAAPEGSDLGPEHAAHSYHAEHARPGHTFAAERAAEPHQASVYKCTLSVHLLILLSFFLQQRATLPQRDSTYKRTTSTELHHLNPLGMKLSSSWRGPSM